MAESAAIEPGCEGGDGELDRSCTGRQSRLARVGKLRAEQRPKERTARRKAVVDGAVEAVVKVWGDA